MFAYLGKGARAAGVVGSLAGALLLGAGDCRALTFTASGPAGTPDVGSTVADFNGLPGPNSATGGLSNGILVSFTGGGQTRIGTLSGAYATPFGDATQYLSTGIGTVKLAFSGPQNYLGLLWGSVDTFNTLTFLLGGVPIAGGTLLGSQIPPATGDQGTSGTHYVNIHTGGLFFDSVIASSTAPSFEFDNVAYANETPLPAAVWLFGTVLGGSGLAMWRRRKSARAAVA